MNKNLTKGTLLLIRMHNNITVLCLNACVFRCWPLLSSLVLISKKQKWFWQKEQRNSAQSNTDQDELHMLLRGKDSACFGVNTRRHEH
mmetsp:Transcript_74457/g.205232  ORF Transcript_74457/g.205232 Transcript_74457/m.205232 type:complete len:88 (-) Transcript_74457:1848-2111(-)